MPTKRATTSKVEAKGTEKSTGAAEAAAKSLTSKKRKRNEITNTQQAEENSTAKSRSRSKPTRKAKNSVEIAQTKKVERPAEKSTVQRSARVKAAALEATAAPEETVRERTKRAKGGKADSQEDELLNVQDVVNQSDKNDSQSPADDEVGLEVQRIKALHDARQADDERAMSAKLIKFDQVYSIYGLVEHCPNKFKDVLDELIASPDGEEANSDTTILKTIFLYFLELMGVSKDEDLQLLVEKTLVWTKEQEVDKFFKERKPEELINFDTLQLCPTEKEGGNHKKFFKRFCKIIITDLVDMFPKRNRLIPAIVDKVCIIAQSKVRLVRFGFTYIAFGLMKVLLHQFSVLSGVIGRLRSQPTLCSAEDSMITQCHDMIKEQLQLLSLEVLHERAYDPQEFIRKHVLESVAQLDATEIKAAGEIQDMKLIDLVFESLRDESAPIRKLALQNLSQMLIKYHQREGLDQDELAKYFKKQKLQLVRLSQPVLTSQDGDQQQTDPQVMLKAIQVLERMLEIIPEEGILDQDCITKITNLVHFPDRKIKEEVGHFMILLSDEIDDPASLLEVQKFNLNKIENQNAGGEEQIIQQQDHRVDINFTAEPRKSKKQLQKLMSIVETYCKSKDEMQRALAAKDGQNVNEAPTKQSKSNPEGELAQLMLEIYGRKTSVLYDLSAITELMQQHIEAAAGSTTNSDSKLKLLANLLYFSLANIYQNKDNRCPTKDFQASFDQYWRLALNHLSLKKINELIQPNRTNFGVIEPILKALFLICQARAQSLGPQAPGGSDAPSEEADGQVCHDLVHVLRDLVAKEQENMNIVKLSIINLVKLKDIYPKFKDQSLLILRELIESLQELMRKQFENPTAPEDQDQIISSSKPFAESAEVDASMLVLNCKKFNQVMSSVSLVSMISTQQVKEWCLYIISKVFRLLKEQSFISKVSAEQIGVVLTLPLESLKQLYYQQRAGLENREEVASQIAVSSELLDEILELFGSSEITARPEHRLQVFKSLIAALELITGDNSLGHQSLFDLRSCGRIQEVITSVINSASRPFFYSDHITLEYFQSLLSFVSQNTEAFMSQVGVEFMINFTLNHHHSSGSAVGAGDYSHTVSGRIQNQLKKLLHVQKTRDAAVPIGAQQLAESKDQDPHTTPQKQAERGSKCRSIFYSFVLRCTSQLLKEGKDDTNLYNANTEANTGYDSEKLLQFLHTTRSDIATQMEADSRLPPSDKILSVQFMRAKAVQVVIKSMLSAIMMAVMSKRSSNTAMTQKQEEQTYCQFIEDFLNFSFRKQTDAEDSTSYPNLLLLASLPQLMHGAFINQPMQLKVLEKVKDLVSNLAKEQEAAPAGGSLPAVVAHLNIIIDQHLSKIQQAQLAQKTKQIKAKQPTAARKVTDLASVKASLATGTRRSYAQKAADPAGKRDDSTEPAQARSVKANSRKQRSVRIVK